MSPKAVLGLAGALIVVLIVSSSVYIIPETHRGVLLRFGELIETNITAGLHFKVPVIDQVREFDVRVMTNDLPSRQYLTIEKKPLDVDSYIAWKIEDVDEFYRTTGGDELRAVSLLSSRVDNGLRDEFGVRTMHEVVSGQRDELMQKLVARIDETVVDELGVKVLDIRVKAIELPQSVSEAVYRRMQTERQKLAQEFRSRGRELAEGIRADADRQHTVVLAEAFAKAEETRGEGDGEAAAIYAKAYQNDEEFYRFYRSLTAYSETFSGQGDIMVIDSKSDFMRYLGDQNGEVSQP
ncbi:MAG: HflC protein [Alteromonadaceae bacterium]|uniref:protease modulator HflC n=1 Tax=unclassified Marinobacter TaxID=83889 RepID=UPI000C65EACC|nr:protease modulator HflC [Marinobacter sp. BGYM27]MAA66059.1 HflC protein [Alteromonadaceae bacterium]MBH86315.1 HflC protein [Alteromonadaceae bacterium]MDG5499310.1 protease modulator HflC [Marinobacter sp. BGYM27]|tara:strand:- start:10886 stop:11770 length:885 start_codon:yes stop_codon:yes gene_type:complete